MWTCPNCNSTFKITNQNHFCDSTNNFLSGKTEVSLALYRELLSTLEKIGPIILRETKSMMVIASDTAFAYIIKLGKNFIDIVLPFNEPFAENLCFRKIALVPGSNQYNHHLRIMTLSDFNEEVTEYFRKAYANGKNISTTRA
ncbi:DUF5655 domain-containing protein [Pedobacter namyangjuensis]|uniref:DUF5655 domain-containing protein n=1 Tax=Pedobacter namyangjuensis TaxID=600626 RepID=UPI001F0672CF|nr:DUF5655 domain-containing protein [Pedobacter namyangjuensis]